MTDITHDSPEAAIEAARRALAVAQAATVDAAVGSALVLGRDDAEQTKRQLQVAHATARKQAAVVQAAAEKAKEMIEAQRRALDEQLRALTAELEPMMKQAARWQDGIAAVNLYLGRDEEIEILRDGEPAPAGTPIVLRQQVLAMDEESGLNAALGGIDHTKIDAFLDWLLDSEDHVQQVIPDQRCVVAIMPRRRDMDYGDPWSNVNRNAENHHTYWLLRNGQKLYLMTTEFNVGARVTPRADEFTALFLRRGYDGVEAPLEPGTRDWLRAEEAADLRTRHFMKVALLLQGIVDRTSVFRPIDGTPSFLEQRSYDSGEVVIVSDDELALTAGMLPFTEWQKAKIAELAPGMRIVGSFPTGQNGEYVTPRTADAPKPNVPHTIAREDTEHFYFTYERTDRPWRRDAYWDDSPAKTRATYRLERAVWGVASYVPMDNVTDAELDYYLNSRTERGEYAKLLPALRAALAARQAERAAEAPFAALIAAALIDGGYTDDGPGYAAELIAWWKTANKWHRALNGEPQHEARAQRGILREAARRAAATIRPGVLAGLREAHPNAIAIAARTSDIVVVEAQPSRYPADATPDDVFVRLTSYTVSGKRRPTEQWKTLTAAQVAKWTVAESTEQFAALRLNIRGQLTDDAADKAIAAARGMLREGAAPMAVLLGVGQRTGKPRVVVAYPSTRTLPGWSGKHLGQDAQAYTVEVSGDEVTLTKAGSARYLSWALPHGSETLQAPYRGSSDMTRGVAVVWEDAEQAAADLALAQQWRAERKAENEAERRANSAIVQLNKRWTVWETERRRVRFVEDFGDESLWEAELKMLRLGKNPFSGHSASTLLAAPLRDLPADRHVPATTLRDVLDEQQFAELVERGVPPEAIDWTFVEADGAA